MTFDKIEFELTRLELKAGDTLVIKTAQSLTAAQVKELRNKAENWVPDGVRVMILASALLPEVIKAG
jgi:hypothetical protein